MKYLILLILSLSLNQFIYGQEGGIETTSYSYRGPCSDNNGTPLNPSDYTNQSYSVKSFKKLTQIDLNIRSVIIGIDTINLDINFNDKIKGETSVIPLTDSVGVKVVVGKVIENKKNKYLYKLIVFKRDFQSDCWRSLTLDNSMYNVFHQTFSLNLYSIGSPDSKDYFQLVEGWVELN